MFLEKGGDFSALDLRRIILINGILEVGNPIIEICRKNYRHFQEQCYSVKFKNGKVSDYEESMLGILYTIDKYKHV